MQPQTNKKKNILVYTKISGIEFSHSECDEMKTAKQTESFHNCTSAFHNSTIS